MVDYSKVLRQITGKLSKAKLAYMLVGGVAVNFYGEPRFTKDIDIVISVDPKDDEKIISFLKKNSFIFHENEVRQLLKIGNRFFVMDPSNTFRIDFWLTKTEWERKTFSRKRPIKVDGKKYYLAACEDLIIFKLLANRPKDLMDIEGILKRQNKLDREYLKFYATSLDVYNILKEIETKLK